MLSYYFDEHFPGPVAQGLRSRGIDVLMAQDDDHGGAEDAEILARATELGRIVVTTDQDFPVLVATSQAQGNEFSGVIFGHQRSLNFSQCINDLELVASACTAEEMKNTLLYLPL